MKRNILLLLVLLHYEESCLCFNVEHVEKSFKILSSPVIKSLQGTFLPNYTKPSFYGHSVQISNHRSAPRIFVSAPKMNNVHAPQQQSNVTNNTHMDENEAQGGIESCILHFDGMPDSCSVSAFPDVESGDSFGLSLANEKDEMMACSPGKMHNCTPSINLPGYCYESSNMGKTWTEFRDQPDPVCKTLYLDVIFVLDGSGSVKGDFEVVKSWASTMTEEFDVENGTVQIGVIQYSHWKEDVKDLSKQPYIQTEVALGQYKNKIDLTKAISNIRYQGYTTYTAHALNKTILDFQASPRWESKVTKRVMILLTDGRASDGEELQASADYVRSMGIITFAVGVGSYKRSELRIIANGNLTSDDRVYSVAEFSGLSGIVNSLRSDILDLVLEGGATSSSVVYKMDHAQKGFAIRTSPQNCPMLRRGSCEIH